ncbi:MAG TPA: hypothetical protein VET25_02650, partial [Aestuariivirgaceae bacterium]|nr:hypothetical protein [Aestuariivirgaceae bacterium]
NGAEGALRQVLSNNQVIRMTGSTAYLQCERSQKMIMLNALSGLGQQVLDIHIEEPSLEEVFLGSTDITS